MRVRFRLRLRSAFGPLFHGAVSYTHLADKPEEGAADEASAPDPSVDAAGEQPVAAGPASPEKPQMPAGKPAPAAASAQPMLAPIEHLTYKELVGYDEAVRSVRSLGLGMQKDPEFQQLVRQLNVRHGLDRMPACDALLIRSPAREDANQFMMATCGELGLPVLRMRMEENMQDVYKRQRPSWQSAASS